MSSPLSRPVQVRLPRLHPSARRPRRASFPVLAAIVAAVAASSLAPAAVAAAPAPPVVPSLIGVEEGNKVFLVGHAVGVQIYTCNATPGGFRWGLLAPRADLFDDDGKLVSTHFGGPTWQARDGSTVVGRRDEQVTVDPTAIPWLRLSRASTTTGPDGDRLAATTFIQRIATTGGLPPAPAECDSTTAGTERGIPYTADYYFWKSTGA